MALSQGGKFESHRTKDGLFDLRFITIRTQVQTRSGFS